MVVRAHATCQTEAGYEGEHQPDTAVIAPPKRTQYVKKGINPGRPVGARCSTNPEGERPASGRRWALDVTLLVR